MDEKEKEQIKFHLEKFRLAIIGIISVGGGTISMITTERINGAKAFFISFGILAGVFLVSLSINMYKTIKRLIK